MSTRGAESAPTAAAAFGVDYAREQLRRRDHPLRRWVKNLYLRDLLRDIDGPSLDIGCGAGSLLRRLPAGSVGTEVNPALVQHLRLEGLSVAQARGSVEDFDLAEFPADRFGCLVLAHVLEHLQDPAEALDRLLRACRRLGIHRLIVVVPGLKGYRSDPTHRTFIDADWIARHPVAEPQGWILRPPRYFPGPPWVGRFFAYHEMKLVFDRRPDVD